MISLNNTSIFMGQIKQILKDFNLPLCRVGDDNLMHNSYYIKNNNIYYKNANGSSKKCFDYIYDYPYLNITDNLKIENLIYDRYTHEYLGKYLRFMRDFKKINLMSMYNCFDERFLDYDIKFNIGEFDINFESTNNGFISYKIPVSLVSTYSISIHNTKNIEVCLYDEKDSDLELSKKTYRKIKINNLFHYEVGEIDNLSVSNDLFLLLKVPRDFNNSIVVLEGKYYDKYLNLNPLIIGKIDNIDIKIAAQLLSTENTRGNYLLADRIVEYLTGNVIYELSEPYDIKRMQITLDNFLVSKNLPISPSNNRKYGIWNNHDVEIIKYIAISHSLIKYDFLGYVDKDIEKYLIANPDFDNIQFDFRMGEDN